MFVCACGPGSSYPLRHHLHLFGPLPLGSSSHQRSVLKPQDPVRSQPALLLCLHVGLDLNRLVSGYLSEAFRLSKYLSNLIFIVLTNPCAGFYLPASVPVCLPVCLPCLDSCSLFPVRTIYLIISYVPYTCLCVSLLGFRSLTVTGAII